MLPVTSNHEVQLFNWKAKIVENKGFQIPPLSSSYRIRAIYTIRLKSGLIAPF